MTTETAARIFGDDRHFVSFSSETHSFTRLSNGIVENTLLPARFYRSRKIGDLIHFSDGKLES